MGPGGADAGAQRTDPRLVNRLEARAQGSVEVSTKAGTGFAGFIKAGRNGDLLPSSAAAPKAKAAPGVVPPARVTRAAPFAARLLP